MTTTKRNGKRLAAEALVATDRDLMKEALQEVSEGEMTEFVGAAPGERTENLTGYRSGYYSRSLVTRIGKLELRVPRDRSGEFSTALFERYARCEKALVAALAEMHVQVGVDAQGQGVHAAPRGRHFNLSRARHAVYDYLARYDTHLVCWYNNATGSFVPRQAAADGEVAEQE